MCDVLHTGRTPTTQDRGLKYSSKHFLDTDRHPSKHNQTLPAHKQTTLYTLRDFTKHGLAKDEPLHTHANRVGQSCVQCFGVEHGLKTFWPELRTVLWN